MPHKGIRHRQDLRQKSRELRRDGTLGEALLWNELRARQLGVGFRRQVPIGDYIVDFFCKDLLLIIEIDGRSHWNTEQGLYDVQRQEKLERRGLRMLSFTEAEVRKDPVRVAESIRKTVEDILEARR